MTAADGSPEPEACYRALRSRDARFDGCFFTGVTSTGIYCRPVCRVRAPKRENCRFFELAAQAERDGYRPCLRCRPELAPREPHWSIQESSAILATQAARLLDDPNAWGEQSASVERLASRLGISDRHLRRIFDMHLGVTPVQYLQTRRLLCAKQLLADTQLPITSIAFASGFSSLRRFNAAFLQHYGLSPSALRSKGSAGKESTAFIRLAYRPPYEVRAMLDFFRTRQLDGVEWVSAEPEDPSMGRTLRLDCAGKQHTGWLWLSFDPQNHLVRLRLSDSLHECLPLLLPRLRGMLDLDADPRAIDAVLHQDFPQGAGLRVPGTIDAFELAVRAILGQQVTVAAARTLTQRLVDRLGSTIDTPHAALHRLFPGALALANAEPGALGELGIVRQRQQAIISLARAVVEGRLHLHAGVMQAEAIEALKQLPGIGDWTAQYIAMRALRWPDAFPSGDVALRKALGSMGSELNGAPQPIAGPPRLAAAAAEQMSQAWRPWRAYAVIRAWSRLGTAPVSTRRKPLSNQESRHET